MKPTGSTASATRQSIWESELDKLFVASALCADVEPQARRYTKPGHYQVV
jgi:hypothetical protein